MIEIACAESLPGEWTPGGSGARRAADARSRGSAPTPICCRYRARPGVQAFERFEWCAIRWMQLTVRDAPDGVVFRGLGANLVNYPVEQRGALHLVRPGARPAVGHRRLHPAPVHARRLGGLPEPRAAPVAGRRDGREPGRLGGVRPVRRAADRQVPGPGGREPAAGRPDPDVRARRPPDRRPADPRLDAAVDPRRRRPLALRRRPRDHRGDLPVDRQGAGLVRAADRARRASSPTCPTGTSWTGPASAATARPRR